MKNIALFLRKFGILVGRVTNMANIDLGIWNSKAVQQQFSGGAATPFISTAIASSATIAPTSPFTPVSGTESIATISLPFTGFAGQITLIATGAWTMTTTGNIATNFTAVASQAVDLIYLPGTALWYPKISD